MNHLDPDIQVSTKEFKDTLFGRVLGDSIDFRIKHLLMYFSVQKDEIVFGSSVLYMAFLKKIFFSKKKIVLLNISLNRLLNKYSKSNTLVYNLVRYLISEIDVIVSLSKYQQDQLIQIHDIPENKLKIVPLGVDVNFYKPVYRDRGEYILSVGRDNGRDYKTVIEVARSMPDKIFHLVLSKRNIEGIDNIPKNVVLFFDLPFSELVIKYRECAMLLLITYSDNYIDGSDCSGQTVLLDAFASGIPVIATEKGYIKDYAEANKHVLLVKPYDVKGIISMIKSNKGELGYNARQKAENEFSTDIMGKNLSQIFRNI
jgi:glycosyltransferase involved in cell wall biosynthesis